MASQQLSGRAASMARRSQQVHGKGATKVSATATRYVAATSVPSVAATPAVAPSTSRPTASASASTVGRNASRLRRQALSSRGKAGMVAKDRLRSEALTQADVRQKAQSAKGDCGCGGDCCQDAGEKSTPSLSLSAAAISKRPPVKPKTLSAATGRLVSRARRSALSSRGKNGIDAHKKGTSSASLARQANPDLSSRDVARIVRDQRSRAGSQGSVSSAPSGRRQRPRNAAEAMKAVSGTRVGHSEKLTGVEAGLCHRGITGTEYFDAQIFEKYCKTEAPRAAAKVEITQTLRGGRVTSGGKVGGSIMVTGDERGSCRTVTGTEYLGREHFATFCESAPQPGGAKVSHSKTQRGLIVSGSKPARSGKVTGNEPGTCKAVTGTPYAGSEELNQFCSPQISREAVLRTLPKTNPAGHEITGIQPGMVGKRMTGAERGACEPVTGTPYVGSGEYQDVCGVTPAMPGQTDFPQAAEGSSAMWGQFSVVPPSGVNRGASTIEKGAVTGTGYEQGHHITGTFSMGRGKVTGTEQFRFGERAACNSAVVSPATEAAAVTARITGEGIDTGLRITGDDWDRGTHVTGTEGASAVRRNPTKRGPVSAMPQFAPKRNVELERPSATVTGGSGGSDKGAAVTVSGGARG